MILTVTLNPAIDKLYLVDRLDPCTVMRVREVRNTAGGKGLNVSRVAARLGEPVTAMGFVGGCTGMLLEKLLDTPNIEKAFTHIEGETRCCINVRDTAAGCSTEFLEPGSPVLQKEKERFLASYREQLPKASVVVLSGSMPQGVPADFYARLVALAKQQGKPVLADTSSAALKTVLLACPTLIKPNTDELQQLLAVDVSSMAAVADAARALHAPGIAIAAISLGADGVVAACGEGVFRVRPPRVKTVNTVGSGDSMVAGFAVGLARGLAMEDTLRLAAAVGTANTLTGETGNFLNEDLKRLLPQIQIDRLSPA